MKTQQKAEQLSIRVTTDQRAKLAEATRLQKMNISQFVLSKSLEAADEVIADQRIIALSASDFDWFVDKLKEPVKDLPKLRSLFSNKCVFEKRYH